MASHNFHLPLSKEMYALLKNESLSKKKPITQIVVNIIEIWSKAKDHMQEEKELTQFINNYKWETEDLSLLQEFESASLASIQEHEKDIS